MNTTVTPHGSPAADAFLSEVDFKWLMAGQGVWVDPERLHSDAAYARGCLRTALRSPCEALRRCARALARSLMRKA